MKICLRPNINQIHPTNGIGRVVGAQYRYLPQFGIEVVDSDADLYVGHTTQGGMPRIDVLSVHGFYWLGDKSSGDYGAFHIRANDEIIDAARKAQVITVPSQWVGECLRRDMRIDPVVIGHGIDFDEWQPSQRRGGYALYAKNRVYDVCYPDAPFELAKRGLPIVSTFAPDGVTVPSNMEIIGRQEAEPMKRWLREADVYLATTKETFGIQTLEAMACAVPVVGWDYGGTAEIITNGYDGLLVKPGDYDALYNAVNEAYARRAELGAHARETASQYAWVNVIEQYADLFKRTYEEMQQAPRGVSIVITNYNYGKYLLDAVNSAMNQTLPAAEVIVVDDGSTDGSPTIVMDKSGVTLIEQSNRGVSAARTLGIERATQPYIICLDADDRLDPHYIETLLPAIDGARDIGIVYSNLTLCNENGDHWLSTGFPPEFDWEVQAKASNPPSNCIPSAALFRREMWRRAGPHKQEYAPGEDAEFWTRGLSTGYRAVKVTNAGLIWYRMHAGSASRRLKYRPVDDRLPWMRDKRYPLAAPSKYAPLIMSYSEPKVSIVVAVDEDTIKHLPDTADSISGQTMREWELIAVFCHDGWYEWDRYPFIKYNSVKEGVGHAFKTGLDMARAPLVLFMRAGDMLTNSALEEMLAAHINNGGRYVYTDALRLNEHGQTTIEQAGNYQQTIWQKPLHGLIAMLPTAWARKVGFKTNSHAPLTDFYSRLALGGCCGKRLGRVLTISRAANIEPSLSRKRIKDLEGMKMAGCCGGSGDALLAAKAALDGMIAQPVEAGKIRLEYIGENTGAISFFGKKNRVYQGGRNDIEGHTDAVEEDVDFLINTGKWKRAINVITMPPPEPEKPEPEPIKAAPVAEVEKPSPIEDDMTPEQEAALNAQVNEQLTKTRKRKAKA